MSLSSSTAATNKLEGACASGELVHKPANPQMLVTTLQGVLAEQPSHQLNSPSRAPTTGTE